MGQAGDSSYTQELCPVEAKRRMEQLRDTRGFSRFSFPFVQPLGEIAAGVVILRWEQKGLFVVGVQRIRQASSEID